MACAYVMDNHVLISKDCSYINAIIILMFIVQQILVVSFEFTGAARGFMIMSCAARGVKKVGQHWLSV